MTVSDLLDNSRPPLLTLLVALAGALLAAARVIGKRAAASMQRQGTRIGDLELLGKSEQTRRRQLEECLRAEGFRLPYWPDDPPELYRPPPPRHRYDEDDLVDDRDLEPVTSEQRRPVPAPPAHRR